MLVTCYLPRPLLQEASAIPPVAISQACFVLSGVSLVIRKERPSVHGLVRCALLDAVAASRHRAVAWSKPAGFSHSRGPGNSGGWGHPSGWDHPRLTFGGLFLTPHSEAEAGEVEGLWAFLPYVEPEFPPPPFHRELSRPRLIGASFLSVTLSGQKSAPERA
jgi:hypothetical protein